MMQPRMQQKTGPRLTLCVGVALAVHASLLWRTADSPSRQFGPAQAFTVRSLNLPAEGQLHELAPPQLPPSFAIEKLQRLTPLTLQPTLPSDPSSHADAAAPDLRYPDAALPGGRARATVALSVEQDGYVRELAVEPQALPPAFERAVQRAFEGSLLTAEMRGTWRGAGRRTEGRVCVEVSFQEGEQPSWRRVSPSSFCAAAA